MSSKKAERSDISGFVGRFIEVCGSDRPRDVQRLLNISYSAAKNYLTGCRLPDPHLLLVIADVTPFSIHWLLTGRGKKFVEPERYKSTPLPPHQLDELVRKVKVQVISEIGARSSEDDQKPVAVRSADASADKADG